MNSTTKILFGMATAIGLAALSACGGGDTADRLDVADPVVRFVDASQIAPNLTLYKDTVAQSDATNVTYPFASNFFDIDMGASVWSAKTTVGAASLGSVSIDPVRGNRYTIVTLPTSSVANSTILYVDPYNKPLGSSSSHLRLVNGSFNAPSVDVYMTAVGADISGAAATPLIPATAFQSAGPASGSDSADIPGGTTYQVTITTAGTKTILFKGQLAFDTNRDVLLVTVPASATTIKVIAKIEGIAGATEIPAI